MGNSIKERVIRKLADGRIRKLLIQLGLRKVVIHRDFYAKFGYKIPKKNPGTFNEKINWVKLYREDERMSILTDKYLVRDWVKKTVGEEYVIPIYGVYQTVEEFKKALPSLPDCLVVKATNGGGGKEVILCTDKKEINWEEQYSRMARWFEYQPYYRNGEWQYKNLTPRILCEEMVDVEANDFKFFCFGGKVVMIQVDLTRFSGHKQQFFDLEWNQLPIRYVASPGDEVYPRPDNLKEMISVAEKLSAEFEFVRVDLYNVNNKIYFGEMTFTPNNGVARFKPDECDRKLGDLWKLDESRKKMGAKDFAN